MSVAEEEGDLLKDPSNKKQTASQASILSYAKTLDRVHEQKLVYLRKLDFEKRRKKELDTSLEEAKQKRRALVGSTRNGVICNEDHAEYKKQQGLLEKRLQTLNMKLSMVRKENKELKEKIDMTRREKVLRMEIVKQLTHEEAVSKRKLMKIQRDTAMYTQKKRAAELSIVNTKSKILADAEEFTQQVNETQQKLNNAKDCIMQTISERSVMNSQNGLLRSSKSRVNASHAANIKLEQERKEEGNEIREILEDMNLSNVEELWMILRKEEDTLFSLYNNIQAKSEEWEKIEYDNKELEGKLKAEKDKTEALKMHNEKVREDLETQLKSLKDTMNGYEAEYAKNLSMFNSMSESLGVLLKTVADDGRQEDQELLIKGVNDRNIEDFLGMVEQRIDELKQMLFAANQAPLQKEDFVNFQSSKQHSLRAPALPSMAEIDDDEASLLDVRNHMAKVHPINARALREYMSKKYTKAVGAKKELLFTKKKKGAEKEKQGRLSRRGSMLSQASSVPGSTTLSSEGTVDSEDLRIEAKKKTEDAEAIRKSLDLSEEDIEKMQAEEGNIPGASAKAGSQTKVIDREALQNALALSEAMSQTESQVDEDEEDINVAAPPPAEAKEPSMESVMGSNPQPQHHTEPEPEPEPAQQVELQEAPEASEEADDDDYGEQNSSLPTEESDD